MSMEPAVRLFTTKVVFDQGFNWDKEKIVIGNDTNAD